MSQDPENGDDDQPARDGSERDLGEAVDDAMGEELRRQRARFVQEIVGFDRGEGVGRRAGEWEDGFDRAYRDEFGPDDPDDASS